MSAWFEGAHQCKYPSLSERAIARSLNNFNFAFLRAFARSLPFFKTDLLPAFKKSRQAHYLWSEETPDSYEGPPIGCAKPGPVRNHRCAAEKKMIRYLAAYLQNARRDKTIYFQS